MKKLQILVTTALLVVGLGLAASAGGTGCGAGCCKQQGVKAGWFTAEGNLSKVACENHKAGNCCDGSSGGACCKTNATPAPKADGKAGCCQGKNVGSCCNSDGKAGADCTGGQCTGACKK